MTTTKVTARTTRRLVFQPAPGHPGGKYARAASVPANMPVKAEEVRPGVWHLTASIDGTDDYQLDATADDWTTIADQTKHTSWCDSAACITDPADSSVLHYSAPYQVSAAKITIADDGTGPRLLLSAPEDNMTPEQAQELARILSDVAALAAT